MGEYKQHHGNASARLNSTNKVNSDASNNIEQSNARNMGVNNAMEMKKRTNRNGKQTTVDTQTLSK